MAWLDRFLNQGQMRRSDDTLNLGTGTHRQPEAFGSVVTGPGGRHLAGRGDSWDGFASYSGQDLGNPLRQWVLILRTKLAARLVLANRLHDRGAEQARLKSPFRQHIIDVDPWQPRLKVTWGQGIARG